MNMNQNVTVKELKRFYDEKFAPSQEYLDSMPDLQNDDFVGIPIDFVGIQGMHLPLKVREKNGDFQEVMAEVTGTVSLDAHNRGINTYVKKQVESDTILYGCTVSEKV